MTPQHPNLSLNQQGKDVALLSQQLSAIGHNISPAEAQGEVFGTSTHQVVLSFQKAYWLSVRGNVDQAAVSAMNAIAKVSVIFTQIMRAPLPEDGPDHTARLDLRDEHEYCQHHQSDQAKLLA